MGSMIEFYSFLRFEPGHRVGHNPLAALTYFIIYLLFLVEILTGLALYSRVVGNPVLTQFIGWLPLLIDPQYLREIHFFLMFVFFSFVIFHVYLSVLVSIEEENGLLDSIFSGWKFVPAGELRHEVAAIPEARRFVKRHQLLPEAGPGEKRPPTPRPGPGPVALYRNWISFAGTGIAAVGLFVFVVLTAYHTIGGGALAEPYGDLVIFFGPPMLVIAGVFVVLIGMYVQWIRGGCTSRCPSRATPSGTSMWPGRERLFWWSRSGPCCYPCLPFMAVTRPISIPTRCRSAAPSAIP